MGIKKQFKLDNIQCFVNTCKPLEMSVIGYLGAGIEDPWGTRGCLGVLKMHFKWKASFLCNTMGLDLYDIVEKNHSSWL